MPAFALALFAHGTVGAFFNGLADELGVTAPFVAQAATVYAQAMARGRGHEDMAAASRVVAQAAGVALVRSSG